MDRMPGAEQGGLCDDDGGCETMRERAQSFDPRQNMLVQSYEIFHYRDAGMDSVAVHHHDFYEIYLFLGGNVDYSIEGRNYCLQSGDLLLISPMELHQLRVNPDKEPYERIVLWINKSFLSGLSTGATSLTRCFDTSLPTHTNLLRLNRAQRANISAKLGELVRESYGDDYGRDLASTGILLQLLVEVNRLALEEQRHYEAEDRAAPLMAQVLGYINEHYCEELSLDGLAGRFFISKYHLAHEFNRLVGTSVYRYIILKRLIIAKQMLSGGVPPTDVYQNCGFGDYANFYRAFKAEYGTSPKEFAGRG